MKPLGIVLSTVCALIVAAAGFAASGLYNVSAKVPHLAPTTLLLETVRDRSIAHHGGKIELPAPGDPTLARAGVVHFDATCRKCHGAPGLPREEFAQGLYPQPPLLSTTAKELSREEIFWVIDNGLKMTGMPAFGINHDREEIISMVAFIEKLPELDGARYGQFAQEAKADGSGEDRHGHGEPSQGRPQGESDDHSETHGDNHP